MRKKASEIKVGDVVRLGGTMGFAFGDAMVYKMDDLLFYAFRPYVVLNSLNHPLIGYEDFSAYRNSERTYEVTK